MAIFSDNIRTGSAAAGGGTFEITNSIRFDGMDNGYLKRTPSSTGNQKVWTWSGWIKRNTVARDNINTQHLFSCDAHSGNNGIAAIYIHGSQDKMHTYFDTTGNNPYGAVNDRLYRDVTGWMHVVWQGDAGNDQKIWINGVQESVSSGTYPPDYSFGMNESGIPMLMGSQGWDGHNLVGDFLLAEVYYSDGTKYTASDFGETNSDTGVWSPKSDVSITYGTNGFHLKFDDTSSTTTLGYDSSGNNNHFTLHNMSAPSAGWPATDSLTDTPTNNFCTLNCLDRHNDAITRGGLETATTGTGGHYPIYATMGMKTGKWYYEAKRKTNDGFLPGIMEMQHDHGSHNTDSTVGNNTSTVNKRGYGLLTGDGRKSHNGTYSSYGSGLTNQSDILMCAYDADNGKVYWGKNGTWFDSGDPAAGSNPAFSGIDTTKTWVWSFHHYGNNNNVYVNFGQQGFTYTPPSGFAALCTKEMADPAITLPTDHFDVATWAGNDGAQTISSLAFEPGFVWVKAHDRSENHFLTDDVRGDGKSLAIGTVTEQNNSSKFTGFTSSGFTLNTTDNELNGGGVNYLSYNWKMTGSNASNSNGSISSTIQANTTAGCAVVKYVGNGTDGATVGHGLGVAPDFMMLKCFSHGDNWIAYHSHSADSNPQQYYYEMQNTDQRKGPNTNFMWSNGLPNSTTFELYSDSAVNGNGRDFITYVFSEVEGFSKFGRYAGTGSADNGPYVYCGFRPAFVMTKQNNQNENWTISNSTRSISNPVDRFLRNDETTSETSGAAKMDFLATGFRLRNSDDKTNRDGGDYIYMAFAEAPQKYSNAN